MVKCLYSGRLKQQKQERKHDFSRPFAVANRENRAIIPPKNHNQTVIFSRRPDGRIFLHLLLQDRENQKSSWSASFFFKKISTFFACLPLTVNAVIPPAVCQRKSGSACGVAFFALSICLVISTASSKDCRADSPETTGAWLACAH